MDVAFEGEGDHEGSARSMYAKCRKNPRHRGFLPLPLFSLHKLPDNCRTERHVAMVTTVARRAVKLVVCRTSQSRPQAMKMKGVRRCGSGYINAMHVVGEHSSEPRLELCISTAAHVVFNEEEAQHTSVELFFDDDKDRHGVVIAKGKCLDVVNPRVDLSCFIAEIPRSDLSEEQYANLRDSMVIPDVRGLADMTFTVSHPRGVAKRVTFGTIGALKQSLPAKEEALMVFFQLVCTAFYDCGISEKRCLCFLQYCLWHEETLADMESVFRVSHRVEKSDVLRTLIKQGVLEFPSDAEIWRLYTSFKGLSNRIREEDVKEMMNSRAAICGDATNEESCGYSDNAHGDSHVVSKRSYEAAPVDIHDFHARWHKFDTAVTAAFRRIFSTGKSDKPAGTFSANYSVLTCPGSSGSMVFSIITSPSGDTKLYAAPHLKGRTKTDGLSGGGVLQIFN